MFVKNLDRNLWQEAKAEARLEGITIKEWLERTIKHSLAKEQTLRKRLPNQAKCEICNRIISKDEKRNSKMIAHHDKPNNRKASVVKLLCPPCHIQRHRQLGWGTNYHPKKATRLGKFRCSLCRVWQPTSARAPVETKGKLCLFCWENRKEEALKFALPIKTWNQRPDSIIKKGQEARDEYLKAIQNIKLGKHSRM